MRNRIVYHVTRQYMKQNRRRTRTAFYGVVCMILLLTCVFVGKDTAISYLEKVASAKEGKWHVTLYDMTETDLSRLSELEFVTETAVSGNLGYTGFAASANADKPYLYVKAYSEPCFDWMNIKLSEGRLPKNEHEILLSKLAVEQGAEIAIGETIEAAYFERGITGTAPGVTTRFPFSELQVAYGETVEVPQDFPYYSENDSFCENKTFTGESEVYTVVGFMEPPAFEVMDAAAYMALTYGDAALFAKKDQTYNVSLMLDLARVSDDYWKPLRAVAGERQIAFNDYVLIFSGNSSDTVINLIANVMTVFFLALIAAASVILIYNLFNLSFEERSRYLGILCSVGATGRQKRSSVYYEAFTLLKFAVPVGMLAGIGVVWGAMCLLQPFMQHIVGVYAGYEYVPVTPDISAKNLLLVLATGVGTVFVSAYLPARKISKVGPVECIRGNAAPKKAKKKKSFRFLKPFQAEGMLAGSFFFGSARKTRGMMWSAAVFMVVLIVTSFGTSSVAKLISYKMQESGTVNFEADGYDYIFGTMFGNLADYEELKAEILADESVEDVMEWRDGMFIGNTPRETYGKEYWNALHQIFNNYHHRVLTQAEFDAYFSEGTSVLSVLGADERTFCEIVKAADVDETILEQSEYPAIVVQTGELSTENYVVDGRTPEKYQFYEIAHMTDLQKGETLPMSLYAESEEKMMDFPLTVAGYASNAELKKYLSFHSELMYVIVEQKTADKIARICTNADSGEGPVNGILFLKFNEKETGLVSRLETISADADRYLFTKTRYVETMAESMQMILRILMYGFMLLASAICLLNLYNAIRGRMMERQQELFLLQCVGATKKQIQNMLYYECASILAIAFLLAAAVSVPLVLGIRQFLTGTFGYVRLDVPWMIAATAVFVTAAFVLLMTKKSFLCIIRSKGNDRGRKE